jgi:hypothetical protein
MLGNRALGADIIEVGYPLRSGVDISRHVALWDILSRNAIFLTGNGVTDDHAGIDWFGHPLDWTTSAWAADAREATLLQSLRAGRVWCGSLSRSAGAVDLEVDGSCPMGSVSVSQQGSRNVRVLATSVPVGGSVRVVQGPVDYAGTADPRALSRVVAEIPGSDLTGGAANLAVDTTAESYVRTEVLGPTGAVVALSNPAWLLRTEPPRGVPAPRAA